MKKNTVKNDFPKNESGWIQYFKTVTKKRRATEILFPIKMLQNSNFFDNKEIK